MFLKRTLVMMAGILVFIGIFILRGHLLDARLEQGFKNERIKYGVQDVVLTMPVHAPPIPPVPATVVPASTSPGIPDASADSSAPTPPGNAADTNVIIGPVPPSSPATTPNSSSDTNAMPATPPETNGGPMNPTSTMNFRHGLSLVAMSVLGQTMDNTPREPSPANAEEATSTNANESATNEEATPAQTNTTTTTTNVAPLHTTKAAPAKSASIPRAALAGGRAIVLGYHQFTGPGVPSKNIYSMSQDVFESEMKYLRDNGYNVVPLSDVVAFVQHRKNLPPNAVAITIDDGYKSALVYAWPVLKKYGYPWTYFVYPQFITRTEGKGAASWPDLVELNKEGVDVESHSMTHPQLTKHFQKFNSPHAHALSPEEYDQFLTTETAGSKAELEQNLGKTIKYFAYPYGDYNKQVQAKVIEAGYEAVFTVANNPVHVTTDVHSIGRYIITRPVEHMFAAYLHQGALSLAKVEPEPGATVSNPRPVITAVLGFDGDPNSIETDVRDYGVVKHDFDPETSTVRLYLPRDLIQPQVIVNIRAKDEKSGQIMVANWHFNFEPSGTPVAAHQPIPAAAPATTNEEKPNGEFATETNHSATNRAPAASATTAAEPSPTVTTNPPPTSAPAEPSTNQ